MSRNGNCKDRIKDSLILRWEKWSCFVQVVQTWIREILLGGAKNEKIGWKASSSPLFLNQQNMLRTRVDGVSAWVCRAVLLCLPILTCCLGCLSNQLHQLLTASWQFLIRSGLSLNHQSLLWFNRFPLVQGNKEQGSYHKWAGLPDAHCDLEGGKRKSLSWVYRLEWKDKRKSNSAVIVILSSGALNCSARNGGWTIIITLKVVS